MSAQPAEKQTWTPAEYLAWERAQPERHAYFQGEIFNMSGATREHNLIVGNLMRVLGNALLDRPCEAYPSNMRVKVPATGLYTYPDVAVVCGKPEFEDNVLDTLLNPQVIIEVLSESTERYDRGQKFKSYRTIPTLRDYVLVSQEEAFIEHYVRQANGDWLLREIHAGGRLELASIQCAIVVADIYRKVLAAPEP
jgi:Uma2 family endonuclease